MSYELTDEDKSTYKKAVFDYLVYLRDSGATNMFGAVPYIEQEFGFDQQKAKAWLVYWMESFK